MNESNNKQESNQSNTQEQRENYADTNETMKLCETLKNKVKQLLACNQKKWQNDSKEMIASMMNGNSAEKPNSVTKQREDPNISDMIAELKAEFKEQVSQTDVKWEK